MLFFANDILMNVVLSGFLTNHYSQVFFLLQVGILLVALQAFYVHKVQIFC